MSACCHRTADHCATGVKITGSRCCPTCAHDPRVTLTEDEREAIWAGLRRARHEEAPIPLAHEFHKTHVLWAVGPAVERIIDARLAPIRALIADFDGWEIDEIDVPWVEVGRLRVALDAASAPVSAQQDHTATEGQDEGGRALSGLFRHRDGRTCRLGPQGWTLGGAPDHPILCLRDHEETR